MNRHEQDNLLAVSCCGQKEKQPDPEKLFEGCQRSWNLLNNLNECILPWQIKKEIIETLDFLEPLIERS